MARSLYKGIAVNTQVRIFRRSKRVFEGCVRVGKSGFDLRPYTTARMSEKEVYACGRGRNPRAALAAGLRKAAAKVKAVRRGHFKGVR